MKDDFLADSELAAIGFRAIGKRVRISRHALFFHPERISIGEQARIDAFCILSAGSPHLSIGRNVHVSVYTCILGDASVEIGDFAGVSARCSIFSSSDDFSGAWMTGPTVPDRLRGVTSGPVLIGSHTIVGAGTIILPGVTIGESAGVGAGSLVREDIAPFTIVAGVPTRVIGERRQEHRALADRWFKEGARD